MNTPWWDMVLLSFGAALQKDGYIQDTYACFISRTGGMRFSICPFLQISLGAYFWDLKCWFCTSFAPLCFMRNSEERTATKRKRSKTSVLFLPLEQVIKMHIHEKKTSLLLLLTDTNIFRVKCACMEMLYSSPHTSVPSCT